jgi:2-keto-4-pentenoate hydratase/2-oxohepta-3-ene-1,7-dioic acid hydratase in catechol pathway
MFIACSADGGVGLVDESGEEFADLTHIVSGRFPGHGRSRFCWKCFCSNFADLYEEMRAAFPDSPREPLTPKALGIPTPSPSKIVAASANSVSHVDEMKERASGRATANWLNDFDVFLKAPSSLVGPGGDILLPRVAVERGAEVHHEVELTAVIGGGGFRLTPEQAREAILGYTIGLDITERGGGDRSRRKSYDTFTPVGPWIVPREQLEDVSNLAITLEIDGEQVMVTSTAELIHDVASIVSYASERMTLEPGDLVLTGAGPGVGPIQAGQQLSARIEGVGTLEVGVRLDDR